ncbi:hypothetical protein [Rhizobium sp. BK602]|uniref:hypothetical protein n=1 Tax=Rhizobium sp. BK602 TaxID=2586986 RepID=UPI00160BD3B2|nr:hypothetical protein [Rhizobium sp. BK602]MBB3608686.1 hypothetical protein [Rhizobium sp. BK602]
MKPKLVPNAGRVLRHSSSLRLIEVSIVVGILQFLADASDGLKDFLPFNPIWLTAAGSFAGAAAWGARLIAQQKVSGDE